MSLVQPENKKEFKVHQLIGVAITVLGVIITSWVNVNSKLVDHDKEIENNRQKLIELKEEHLRLNSKEDDHYIKILEKLEEINIKIENKQNRQ